MLPQIKCVPLHKQVFPQSWQTVIFRNYGLVSMDKLAKTLGCDEQTVRIEANRLGLSAVEYDEKWEKRGYITIIRNNWYLLDYEQLKTLLGYDEARLEFVVYKEDFLDVKLGWFKPECPKVYYQPLTEEEIAKTQILAKEVEKYVPTTTRAFEFFSEEEQCEMTTQLGDTLRLIHGYLTPCGDAFVENDETYMPDALLKEYQKQGINGVWVHGLLSALSYYPFDPALSEQYPLRRKNLQKLVDRCAKFGIKVYLYFNEPRFLPMDKIGKYAHLKGTTFGDKACLCFEQQEVQDYLYTAMKDLFSEVHGLGGVLGITMSENPTHCNFAGVQECNCPTCKNIPPYQSASKVYNVMSKALRDSGSGAKLLAYLWGWTSYMGWSEDETKAGISLLDDDIIAVCVSECQLQIEKGGEKSEIIDYSISNVGPSEITKFMFGVASKKGMTCCAKIQTNNSWEMSAVPYMPVYDLVLKHLKNLDEVGVHDYMLTWTLGGYPSPMLGMVADYASAPNTFSIDTWYQKTYGQNAKAVHEAVQAFCAGFEEYPFSIDSLYYSPKTLGPTHLWDLQPQENVSAMVCYAYDDYETWIKPYSYENYLAQLEKLLTEWEKGLRALEGTDNSPIVKELKNCAYATYIHFKSDYLQTKFSYFKRDLKTYKTQTLAVLKEERALAEQLLKIAGEMPTLGFETSNHYFYNDRNLAEKIMQTAMLEQQLENDEY